MKNWGENVVSLNNSDYNRIDFIHYDKNAYHKISQDISKYVRS